MPLFFVHIPKTAGTSFRIGAEQYFRKENIVYDYGKDSDTTSEIARQHLYASTPDFWAFGRACAAGDASLVGGHVGISKFVSLFGVANTITFLREPLERMASEYEHFVRNYGYKGSFQDFYSRPVMHNRQNKILHGVDIEAIGMLGLTERYKESLKVLNARYGIAIPLREDNRGRRALRERHELSEEDMAEFKQLNTRDFELYKRVVALVEARLAMFDAGKPWAHARLVETSASRVAGWAWWSGGSDEPVEVEIWINEELADTVLALERRPGLCHLRPPRGGYVGFHLPVELQWGDKVRCRVAGTGQWFPAGKAEIFR